jgi:hypothetical protein
MRGQPLTGARMSEGTSTVNFYPIRFRECSAGLDCSPYRGTYRET